MSADVEETSCGFDLVYLDNDRILFAGRSLMVWNLGRNDFEVVEPGMRWARQLALSPDRKYLAEVDQTQSTDWPQSGLLVRNTAEWYTLPARADGGNTSGGLAYSPDGRYLATSHIVRAGTKYRTFGLQFGPYPVNDYDYVVHLRNSFNGEIEKTIDGWGQGVRYLAFSPDCTILARTAGPRLRAWDLVNDREIALQKRGTKHFQSIAFMADGRYAATVSNDETVRIWDARSWNEVTTYTWQIGRLLNLVFAPDGMRAAAGSDQGKVVIWDVDV